MAAANKYGFCSNADGRSKLGNILFAKALVERLGPSSNVLVNSLHPGGVQSELLNELPSFILSVVKVAAKFLLWTPAQAALTVMGCAWNPHVFQNRLTGRYYVPVFREDPGSAHSRNATLAASWLNQTEEWLREEGFLPGVH